jgi:fibronectin type 3 domain-containing protein
VKPPTSKLRLFPAVVVLLVSPFSARASSPTSPTLAGSCQLETHASLSWSAVSGATSYNIYRGTSAGSEVQIQPANPVLGTTYEDTGLNNGQTYYYEVTAVNGSESAKSNEVSVLTRASAPSSFSAAAGDSQVALTWSTSPTATSYKIYRDTLGGPGGATSFSVTGTSYTDTGLVNGTTYYYQIAPVKPVGENPKTTILLSATPKAGSNTAPVGAPAGLTATPGSAKVILRWQPVSNATSYQVFRGTASTKETLWTSSITGTTFTDTGLANGTAEFYEVRGVNGSQTGSLSTEVTATPSSAGAPTGLSVRVASGQVVLNWTPTGTSYAVYRGLSTGSEIMLDSGLTGNTFTDVNVTNGITYYYKIQSLNPGSSSALSAEISASPTGSAAQPWTGTITYSLPGEPVQSCPASIPDLNRPVLFAFLQPEGANTQAIATKYNALTIQLDGFTPYNFGTPANPIQLTTLDDTSHIVRVIDYRWPQLSAQRILALLTAAAAAVPTHPEIQDTGFVLYGASEGTCNTDMTVVQTVGQSSLVGRTLAIVQESEIDEDRYNPLATMINTPHLLLASGTGQDGNSTLNVGVGDFPAVTHDAYCRGLATNLGAPLTVINNAGFGHIQNGDNPFIAIWLDSILSQRLPFVLPTTAPVNLPSWQNCSSWVGTYDVTTSTSAPWADSSGGAGVRLINNAVSARTAYTDSRPFTWLPSQNTANSWLTYSNTGNMSALTPVVISAPSATAKVGSTFVYQISATNSPTSFAASGLPSGLTVNTTTGAITGTPKATGVSTLTVSAINAQGSGTATVPLTVTTGTVSTVSFSQWETTYGISGASPTATAYNDGVPYLLRYYSGLTPTVRLTPAIRTAYLPVVGTAGNGQYLTLTYRQYSQATLVTPTVQTSTDLSSWSSVSNPPYYQQSTDPSTGDIFTTVGITITGTGFQFLRLQIKQ